MPRRVCTRADSSGSIRGGCPVLAAERLEARDAMLGDAIAVVIGAWLGLSSALATALRSPAPCKKVRGWRATSFLRGCYGEMKSIASAGEFGNVAVTIWLQTPPDLSRR